MRILVLDSVDAAGATIAHDLNQEFHVEAICGNSIDGAHRFFETHRDSIGIIVKFLDEDPEKGIVFIREIEEGCRIAEIRCPHFLFLTPGHLSAAYNSRFRAMGAECLVFGFPKQLQATVRRMMFETRCSNGKATIIVDRSEGCARFYLLGPAKREMISHGPRLTGILNYLAINFGVEISTEKLAEIAGITVSSVKVYLQRLRAAIELAARNAGSPVPGQEVLCTFRKDGAFVHVLRARVLFI